MDYCNPSTAEMYAGLGTRPCSAVFVFVYFDSIVINEKDKHIWIMEVISCYRMKQLNQQGCIECSSLCHFYLDDDTSAHYIITSSKTLLKV